MLHYPVACGPIVFEHVLDQVDASARAVEFVTQQNERRAGCDTEATMDAVPQYFFGLGDIGVCQLGEGKIRLPRSDAFVHAAGVEDTLRVEGFLDFPG